MAPVPRKEENTAYPVRLRGGCEDGRKSRAGIFRLISHTDKPDYKISRYTNPKTRTLWKGLKPDAALAHVQNAECATFSLALLDAW